MTKSLALGPEIVQATFRECLFKEGEDTSTAVKVEGIVSKVGFHPGRLIEQKPTIEALLDELPDPFKQGGGGGWSFLNACNDKHGNLWTGMHETVEQLMLLGMAINKVQFLMPREMWKALPGGMPYFVIN